MQRSLSWLGMLALACVGCAHFKVQEQFDESFAQTVEGPISRVEVDSSSGDVRIRGVPGARIHVSGRISAYAGNREKARELAQQVARTPPIERSGQVLHIGRKLPEREMFQGLSIDYEVVVPSELSAFVDSSSGDVDVQGLQGAVEVDSSSGDVLLTQVGAAKINSSSGDVVLEDIPGDIQVDSSSGDVRISASPGPRARWEVDSSSGDVVLVVEPGAAFRFHAITSSGSVVTDLPIRVRGTVESDELHGDVGEGPSEAEVKVDSSSGDIELRARPSSRAQVAH